MKVLIYGGTGMVGQGVLRECLLADDVLGVTTIGRTTTGAQHPKLRELKHDDPFDYSALEHELAGFDACFFCIGVASAGKTEAEYSRLTYDLTLAAASTLARLNPGMTFVYVSGDGADSSESGPIMWARVRGRTENAVRKLTFKAAYIFRPAIIQPLHGARSKTRAYRMFYMFAAPLLPSIRKLMPTKLLTTALIGQAMLEVARHGAPKPVLAASDIWAAAARRTGAPPATDRHTVSTNSRI